MTSVEHQHHEIIKGLVELAFEIAAAEFKRSPVSSNRETLDNAVYALQGLVDLDGLMLSKLYAQTPVMRVPAQIREWTAPREVSK